MLREFGVVVLVAGLALPGPSARGAFTLTGTFPAELAGTPFEVTRESLEERTFTSVARGNVAGQQLDLAVDAEPGLFRLRVGDRHAAFVAGAGDALRVSLAGEPRGLHLTGATAQAQFTVYETFRQESLGRLVSPVREAIRRAREVGDNVAVDRLTAEEVEAYDRHRRELNDHTLEHLRGSPALYAASLRWDGDHRLDDLATAVDVYAELNPDLAITKLLRERIARFRATALGAIAPALAGAAPDGTTIALASLRGRHVLVDFWASWCPPCRIENRHYVELHQRHASAGFEILAVSVDHVGSAWRNAIRQDRAHWLHISDLTGWRSPLAHRYNVTALPASFLLDPHGRIIAKNLRGEKLAQLLRETLTPTAAQ